MVVSLSLHDDGLYALHLAFLLEERLDAAVRRPKVHSTSRTPLPFGYFFTKSSTSSACPPASSIFFLAAPEKEYAPTTSFLVRSPEPKTLPGTRTAVAFETIPERWPRFTSTLLEEVVRSVSEASFQIAAFSFLPFRSSITATDLRRGFLVVITSRPH